MLKIKPYLLVCQLQDVASLVWRGSQEKDVCFHKFEVLCWSDATGVWSLMSSWPSILGGFNCLYLLCFHLSASGKVCTPLHCHSESWKHVFPAFHSQWRFWKDKVASLYFILFFLMTLLLSLDAFRASFYHFILRFSNNISQHRVISCWIFFSQPFGPSSRMAFSWSPEGISDWEYILTFPTLPFLFTFTLCRNHQVFGCFTFLVRVLSSLVLFFSPIYIKPYIKYICLSVSIVFK